MLSVEGVRARMRLLHGFEAGKAFKRRVRVGVRDMVEKHRDDQRDHENQAFHVIGTPSKALRNAFR
jgi:hypothetical protein